MTVTTGLDGPLTAYCAHRIFQPGPEVYIAGNPYHRPISLTDPGELDFTTPATEAEFLTQRQLVAGRILCAAYESDMILLPEAGLGSAKAAASELGLSPSALSRRVAALEDFTGKRLFTRQHQAMKLTDEGQTFYNAVSPKLEAGQQESLLQELNSTRKFYTFVKKMRAALRAQVEKERLEARVAARRGGR